MDRTDILRKQEYGMSAIAGREYHFVRREYHFVL